MLYLIFVNMYLDILGGGEKGGNKESWRNVKKMVIDMGCFQKDLSFLLQYCQKQTIFFGIVYFLIIIFVV